MLHLITFLLCLNVVLAGDDKTFALKFLNQYHYISQTRSGTHDVTSAVKNFQHYFHLPVSGTLDEATVGLMKKSRCGMPDGDDEGSVRRKRFVTVSRWDKTHLTYFIDYGQDLGSGLQDQIFRKALTFWADVSKLSFSQVNTPEKADIKISFGAKSHDGTRPEDTCAYPFDGEGGVLAHAYFPSDGRAHFDESEYFTHENPDGTDLLWVATHEFGHSLGLEHTNKEGAVMFPYYTGYSPNMGLHSDDIAGIQSLYGDPSGYVPKNPAGPNPPTEPVTVPAACNDKVNNCLVYKDANYCVKHPKEMQYWCIRTCSLCS